ncbi:MAG: hypothetical protein CVU54_11605 [Deltaproteobacteria bacterium HGW-Deltaproteobacteria-12]|nr:MAG: hypothetical protein CVU54_11605 [Deltaproteobacteria bacterium HGW-Deltaproteobacteria-12]
MSVNQIFDSSYWDILDLSHYLKVKVKTLYAMIYDIPHYRVGKLIRFKKEEIEAWMENKKAKEDVKKQPRKKRERSESANSHIDRLIRKTIDQTKQEDYNLDHGKPDLKGSKREEVNNGNL